MVAMMDESVNGGSLSPRSRLANCPDSAYNWEEEHRRHQLYDDGTMTYFWRSHSLTVLLAFCGALLAVVLCVNPQSHSASHNIQWGVGFAIFTFLLVGVTQLPNGPFTRPHPAMWRLAFCVSIVYELFLVFLLFQTPEFCRNLMKVYDESLGEPLAERSYGDQCVIYDGTVPDDPFHNVKAKMDIFVTIHFFGWFIKTLMLRDYWLCFVLSLLFEVLEYTLEHQLANFSECWWDHWIMDFLVCNGCGIYLGMKTLEYLSVKPYHWRGLWNIPSYREKLQRLCAQFTPYSWTNFEWRPTKSLQRWLAMLAVIFMFLLGEVNFFYLKFVLWVPPDHSLHLFRLVLFILIGSVSMRETFQFLDDPECSQFGRQAWMALLIIVTELLLICQIDPHTITRPLPFHMACFWTTAIVILIVYTVWNFVIHVRPINPENGHADSLHLISGTITESENGDDSDHFKLASSGDFLHNRYNTRSSEGQAQTKHLSNGHNHSNGTSFIKTNGNGSNILKEKNS